MVFCSITASVRFTARGRRIALGARLIEVGLRRDALRNQVRLPLIGDLRLRQRCLVAGEVGRLDRDVELDELSALLHVLAALN